MNVAKRILVVAALGTLLVRPGWAQERKTGSIDLARSWDEAYREASIRNVPIIFTSAMAT
ncbi:MAG TPA: hypothetical protein VK661_03300 [Planctomycetota bacterium]|jgi:hypothetical protein|nr:hypothetical protein [Planctomycetota bacterium]